MSEIQVKTIELRKQSFINGDILIAAIICAIIIVWFVMRHSGGQICLFLITVLVVMPLVWRKFARSITVDFEARTVRSIGIVSIFRQFISFDDLAYVRCPAAINLDPAKVFNVVFRRQGAIQPLIFEARSEAERTQARELFAELRRVIPNKMRDDAVSRA
jgi:hypothetical protein